MIPGSVLIDTVPDAKCATSRAQELLDTSGTWAARAASPLSRTKQLRLLGDDVGVIVVEPFRLRAAADFLEFLIAANDAGKWIVLISPDPTSRWLDQANGVRARAALQQLIGRDEDMQGLESEGPIEGRFIEEQMDAAAIEQPSRHVTRLLN